MSLNIVLVENDYVKVKVLEIQRKDFEKSYKNLINVEVLHNKVKIYKVIGTVEVYKSNNNSKILKRKT